MVSGQLVLIQFDLFHLSVFTIMKLYQTKRSEKPLQSFDPKFI